MATAAKEAYAKAYKTLRVLPEITTPETAQEQPAATRTKKDKNEFILKTTQNIAEITKALSEMLMQTAT